MSSRFFIIGLLVILLLIPLQTTSAEDDFLELSFGANPFQIMGGYPYDIIDMESFVASGEMGTPMLPQQVLDIEIPSSADPNTLSLEIISLESMQLEGTYDIGPAPEPATPEESVETGLVDGKNQMVYGADEYYPYSPAKIQRIYQSNEVTIAQIIFTAMAYNPMQHALLLNTYVTVRVSWDTKHVLGSFPPPPSYNGYIIVTTNHLRNNSTVMVPIFTNWLQSRGFNIQVITEDDYGYAPGQQRAINIRNWLITNQHAKKIRYVLLIGNPDPDDPSSNDSYGEIPMLMCWPQGSPPKGSGVPTDHFYADLNGNWDYNSDQFYGEFGPDGTEMGFGVDFGPEVYVGRIPVYFNSVEELDLILNRTISYNGANKSMLLPMAISNFTGEVKPDMTTFGARTDGRDIPKEAIDNIANPQGYTNYVMHEIHGIAGVPTSAYEYDGPLTHSNVISLWPNDYGIVFWWGHGYSQGAISRIWSSDDGDGVPEHFEILSPSFITSGDFYNMSKQTKSFVYMCACCNGWPEDPNNIGFAALFTGAITTVSATRISYYVMGSWNMAGARVNTDLGYEYVDRLVNQGVSAGEALFEAKNALVDLYGWMGFSWQNLMDFNLYGEPSLTLQNPAQPASLTCSLALSPNNVTTGQQVIVNMAVTNNGGSTASNVIPSALTIMTTGTVSATFINAPTSAATLLAGQQQQFSWTLQVSAGASGGTLWVTGNATGADSSTSMSISSSTCTSSAIAVSPYSTLHATIYTTKSGQNCTVYLQVTNQGPITAMQVTPHISTVLSGTSYISSVTSTSNAPVSILAGGTTTFSWSFVINPGTGGGGATFTGYAAGTDSSGPIQSNASSTSVSFLTPASLNVTIVANPEDVAIGGKITVTVHITNEGQSDAINISINSWDIDGNENVNLLQGPSPSSITIPGLSSGTIVFKYSALGPGRVIFQGDLVGIDNESGTNIYSSQFGSNAVTISSSIFSYFLSEKLMRLNNFWICIRTGMPVLWDDGSVPLLNQLSGQMEGVISLDDMLYVMDQLNAAIDTMEQINLYLGCGCDVLSS